MSSLPSLESPLRLESKSILPIHKIDDDILSLIVQINADMFGDKYAFLHTRNASQVCHTWRQTLLASPTLWARLLDIDQLRRMPDWWGHEVLRRAGTAPLWIKSTEIGRYVHREIGFLLHIIDTRWDRVERLYIRSNIVDDGKAMTHHNWDRLFQPAPSLKELGLYISGLEDVGLNSPLLGDSAPLLKVFRAKNVSFSVRAPWLNGLRSVTIGVTTLPDILQMLQGTPRLECMRVENLDDMEEGSHQKSHLPPVVQLRHLELLDIGSSQLRPCSTFLKQIKIPSKCSFITSRLLIPAKDALKYILTDLLSSFSQFLDRYLAFYTASTTSIFHSSKSLSLLSSEGNSSTPFTLHICLEGKYAFTAYVLEIILGAFASGMPKFVSMKFGTFRTPQPVIDVIISFLPRFSLLGTLETDERFIFRLLEEQEDTTGILLPDLHTIKLDTFNVSFFGCFGGNNEENRSALVDYLVLRTELGKPIGVLDLTQCSDLDVNALIPVLEDSSLAGLRVLWARYGMSKAIQKFEHTCGTRTRPDVDI